MNISNFLDKNKGSTVHGTFSLKSVITKALSYDMILKWKWNWSWVLMHHTLNYGYISIIMSNIIPVVAISYVNILIKCFKWYIWIRKLKLLPTFFVIGLAVRRSTCPSWISSWSMNGPTCSVSCWRSPTQRPSQTQQASRVMLTWVVNSPLSILFCQKRSHSSIRWTPVFEQISFFMGKYI